ncbi:SAM-dependent methyltransferase [Aeromicrobium wangtongii]|uniref:Cyclopropane-fatty-acyl-phospholipid synthase family protein n=1 Tax=Aeromicrobium wangtongii TaxID=2969247 RepID=A0ABY5MCK7_9ACTN|nr:cyclopropane-fatty-acyl-phospholipid synthase family protein [Aeromicrobium wangtongii]MCD9197441.1 cyclopropane-fatty-acyl-phospholipid synthase family protein [Aeromicrobium wangtongii]UUP14934.1 cyclopropane-fatty-acyl-phospholipid synthase family protein [Aeromicrobium wangtongii]
MTQIAATGWPGVERTPHAPLKARAARALLKPTVNRLPVQVHFAGGGTWGAGDDSSARMHVVRPKALFHRLGADSKIGLGEAYMAGDWTVGENTDLAQLLTPFAERMATLVPVPLQRFRVFVDQQLPHQQRNSVEGSRRNIEAHYDLSNDLFAQFLDPSMTYSAAWFDGDEDLESAQMRKIDGILDQAGVTAGTRVLEIGSGWGALAIRAAQRGGKVSIQAITMAHHRYLKTRNSYGWIQKYIFPGGLIPSLEAIGETLAEHTSLAVTDRRSLGQDYARTLHEWRSAFTRNWEHIQEQGFDETFRRMWEFYLAYCEAGFAVGYLDVFQLQLTRPKEA